MSARRRQALLNAALLAGLLTCCLFLSLMGLGRVFGREPASAWICGDTRYTQLVPRGRSVVGAPVTPPPGCLP